VYGVRKRERLAPGQPRRQGHLRHTSHGLHWTVQADNTFGRTSTSRVMPSHCGLKSTRLQGSDGVLPANSPRNLHAALIDWRIADLLHHSRFTGCRKSGYYVVKAYKRGDEFPRFQRYFKGVYRGYG
jgi:hypothetical protein